MLDIDNESDQVINAFDLLPCKVQLPEEWDDFFSLTGNLASHFDDNRKYGRHYLRRKAILKRNESLQIVYTKDISRFGIALLNHEQLFPCEKVTLWLPRQKQSYALRITRCQRLQQNCYECGAKFDI